MKRTPAGGVTPDDIKRLRDLTGAGLVDCKAALVACCGYEDLAERWLRVRRLAIAFRNSTAHPCRLLETEARRRETGLPTLTRAAE